MGMFTELNIACELKYDPEMVKTLSRMTIPAYHRIAPLDHEFFHTRKWREMLLSDCLYFPVRTSSEVIVEKSEAYDCGYRVLLNVRCALKNYDNEIEEFLDWLGRYILTEGYIGFKRYETDDLPTLIFVNNGKIEYGKVESVERSEYVRPDLIPLF